jgi:uncharacterized protein (DUF433 family)
MVLVDLFSVDQASRLTGLSSSQLVAWDRAGVLHPYWNSNGYDYGRYYSFRDIVVLRAFAMLRNEHRVPLSELRKVVNWLNEQRDSPWEDLRINVKGRHVECDGPRDGNLNGSRPAGDGSASIRLASVADEMRERVEAAKRRQPDEIGRIVQKRRVLRNAPVLAGTRIPTSAVWDFHEAGYTAEQIIDEYPRLYPEDIRAAIEFEQKRGSG